MAKRLADGFNFGIALRLVGSRLINFVILAHAAGWANPPYLCRRREPNRLDTGSDEMRHGRCLGLYEQLQFFLRKIPRDRTFRSPSVR